MPVGRKNRCFPFARLSALAQLLALLVTGQAAAQQSSSASADGDYDRALRVMLQRLDDPNASFGFAELSLERGDLAGAISALERILRLDPSLDNVRLELGLLYLRAGQHALASIHIEAALRADDMPADVRERAEAQLRVARAASSGVVMSGSLSIGAAYQSNPNETPDSALVNFPFVGEQVVSAADLNAPQGEDYAATANAGAVIVFRPSSFGRHEAVLELTASAIAYEKTQTLSSLTYGARFGARLRTGDGAITTPFVAGSRVMLDGESYVDGVGLGIVHQRPFGAAALGAVSLYAEQRTFLNSASRPRASFRSGDYLFGTVEVRGAAPAGFGYAMSLGAERAEAAQPYESYDRAQVSATALLPVLLTGAAVGPVRSDVTFLFRDTQYDAPDPSITLRQTRSEQRTGAAIRASVDLAARSQLELRVEHHVNQSDIPNFDYDSTYVGFSLRFSLGA